MFRFSSKFVRKMNDPPKYKSEIYNLKFFAIKNISKAKNCKKTFRYAAPSVHKIPTLLTQFHPFVLVLVS